MVWKGGGQIGKIFFGLLCLGERGMVYMRDRISKVGGRGVVQVKYISSHTKQHNLDKL